MLSLKAKPKTTKRHYFNCFNAQLPRSYSTEFKKFFGLEDKLEQTKVKNDKDLEFDVNKMNKLAIAVTSFCKSTNTSSFKYSSYPCVSLIILLIINIGAGFLMYILVSLKRR